MGNKHQDPNLPKLAATPSQPPRTGGRKPQPLPWSETPSSVRSSLEDVFLGCQGNSLPASFQMPAGSSLAPHFQEEKVISEKLFTTMLNSHHMSRVLCGEPPSILYLLAPPTPGGEVNPELCSLLSPLDSPSSAPHGEQHSLLILTGSPHAPALPCSGCKQ